MGKHKRNTGPGNKTVVVRQPTAHRVFVTILSVLFMSVTVFLSVYLWIFAQEGSGPVSLLLILFEGGICVPLTLWHITWRVTLDEQGVRKEVFGRTTRSYAWTQVQGVERFKPTGELSYIYVLFMDGKNLSFRIDWENALEAMALLRSRFSVNLTGRYRADL